MPDTGHTLFDKFGCGPDRRAVLAKQMESGERTFREVLDELYASLSVPFEDGFAVMKTALDIDPDFQAFHEFCINNGIPFSVISAGLKPVLRRVLNHLLGEEKRRHIDIVANDSQISDDGSELQAVWRHDTDLGHDKARSINEAKDLCKLESEVGTIPMIIFIGDGVSDLAAANEADVLFARRGLKLEQYCIEHGLSHIPFDTFADIQREVIKIAKIDEEQTKGHGLLSNFNPRANMWRRASSRHSVPIWAAKAPSIEEKMFTWPKSFSQVVEKAGSIASAAVAAAPQAVI
jgi:2,3-diketo-5-methylthio-1-phosphopentane phosphatase